MTPYEGEWDYIIVGAGSSGCAAAFELSQVHSNRILILEAGRPNSHPLLKIPAGIASPTVAKLFDWGYKSHPDPSRHGKIDSWLRGRVVGGSSSINGMMYVRGAKSDFDRWAALGNFGWSSVEVMTLYDELEASTVARTATKPSAGHIFTKAIGRPHLVTRHFIEAAKIAGHSVNANYNGESQEGVAYAQLNQRHGLRWSSADAFLKPAVMTGAAKVVTGALVQRLQVSHGRVSAVIFRRDGKLHIAKCKRAILSAGAINSPKILMLSGVGGANDLKRLGIEVQQDLPSVGHNLREHPLVKLTYSMRVATRNPTEGHLQKLSFLLQYLRHREGPIASVFEATAFLKTTNDLAQPDVQLHFMPAGVRGLNDTGPFVLPYPSVTILLNKSHPLSSGRIELASGDAADAPIIRCELLSEVRDVDTIVRGIEVVRDIMGRPPINSLIDKEIKPGSHLRDAASLSDYVRRNTELAFHPAGTCRMGVDDLAVVSPELQVRGIQNLWVADASIMPDLISGNTNAVCMMIGSKLGRLLRNT